jgi:DNA-binding GntR family transcriptional regulator
MRLKEEGWLLSLSYRGYLIAPITFQDIADVYEMRLILETACAQIAAVRATEKHLERLGEMIRAEDRLGPHIGTNQGLVDLNFNFHLNLAEISRNARIVDTMQSLLEHVLRFDSVLTRYEPVTPWVKHAEIVAAIRNRDPLRARDKMREHVEAARQRILNAFSGHSLDLSISTFEQPRLHSGGKRPPSK